MKTLHTADIHLREYGDDRWKTLEHLIQVGKKEKIGLFVICGDLFDKGVNAENLRPKIRRIFTSNGFKIVIIPGNHDRESYQGGLYFGEDTVILTDLSAPFTYKKVTLWGMPFEPIGTEKVLNKLHSLTDSMSPEKRNILLCHAELLDAFFSRRDFGDEGEERYMPVKLSYFEDMNLDYVLAGHFHSRFECWPMKNGGYFVYPGSPVSITKRETDQRRANIFEVGKPPAEYLLDTPHFQEIVVQCDPFEEKNPVETVKECFQHLHPNARAILKVTGFIDGEAISLSEPELVKQINKIVRGKCAEEPEYEFKDIRMILADELFKSFMEKLEQADYEEEKKRQIRDIAIKAMIGARV